MKTPSLFDIDPSSSELGSASGLWGLTRIPGVGSQTALAIAGVASSWSKLVEAPEEVIAQADALSENNKGTENKVITLMRYYELVKELEDVSRKSKKLHS